MTFDDGGTAGKRRSLKNQLVSVDSDAGSDERRRFRGRPCSQAGADELGPTPGPSEVGPDMLRPEMNLQSIGSGEQDVITAIAIEIDESKPKISPRRIRQHHALGKGIVGFYPALTFPHPTLNFIGAGTAEQPFLHAIAVKIVV